MKTLFLNNTRNNKSKKEAWEYVVGSMEKHE